MRVRWAVHLAVLGAVVCCALPVARAEVETATVGQALPEPSDPGDRQTHPEAPAPVQIQSTAHGPTRGFDVLRGSDIFRLRIGGTVQLDGRIFLGDDARRPTDTFFPGRIRPILEGDLWRFVTFRLMPDFGTGRVTLEEAWIDLDLSSAIHFRFGKDKANFALERLQGENDIVFIERSQVTQLSPNRDVGIQLRGNLLNDAIEYSAGVWNGVPDNVASNSPTSDVAGYRKKDLIGRIFIRPFRLTSSEALYDIGVGISGSHGLRRGSPKNPQLPAFKTSAQQPLFTFNADAMATAAGTAYANGPIDRYSPQLYAYVGPVGLMAEYVRTSEGVAQGNNQRTLIHDAYEATLAIAITGEHETYRSVTVERPASLEQGTFGAIELVLRYDHANYSRAALGVFADGNTSWNGANGYWVGVNWYLNDNLKLSGDFVHTAFTGDATMLLDHEDAVLVLAQLAI